MTVLETPKTGYSDAELEEFKVIILAKRLEAQNAYNHAKIMLASINADEGSRRNMNDETQASINREEYQRIMGTQEALIKNLDNALARIGNKTFGVCRITDTLIPKERLMLVPHATTSVLGKNSERNSLNRRS